MDGLQAELLNGQKLQGVLTSNEVQAVLRLRGWEVLLSTQGLGHVMLRLGYMLMCMNRAHGFRWLGGEPQRTGLRVYDANARANVAWAHISR